MFSSRIEELIKSHPHFLYVTVIGNTSFKDVKASKVYFYHSTQFSEAQLMTGTDTSAG